MEHRCPRDSHQRGYGFLSELLSIKAEIETWVQGIWGESTSEGRNGGAGRGTGREGERRRAPYRADTPDIQLPLAWR